MQNLEKQFLVIITISGHPVVVNGAESCTTISRFAMKFTLSFEIGCQGVIYIMDIVITYVIDGLMQTI